jgi:hypothetical protein
MIKMARDARESKGRDLFACSNELWVLLQDLGRAFGWQPQGTTYVASGKQIVAPPARHDYSPGSALDRKQLDDEDAKAWARALETAQQSVQFADLLANYCKNNAPASEAQVQTLHSLIYEFTEFSYSGAFTFSEAQSTHGELLTTLPHPHDSQAVRPAPPGSKG